MSEILLSIEPSISSNTINSAIIIYDDFELAVNANVMLRQAARHAREAKTWTVNPIRTNMLSIPPIASRALHEAVDTNLIVLAVRNEKEISPTLLRWLDSWAEHRTVEDAALAVYDGGKGEVFSSPATLGLSRFAKRHGLHFIFDEEGVAEENESAAFLERLHEREVTMTSTLMHILEETPADFYEGWGINE